MDDSTILFVFSIVFFFLKISFSHCKTEGSYYSRMSFLKLDGNIIQAIAVPNILQCCWKCERSPDCFSLNVADVPDKNGLYECQMLRTETNKYSELLQPSQHYHHYTRLSDNVCNFVQCLSGGTCQPEGYFNFRCSCPQGFTGKSCQLKTREYKWLKINTDDNVCFGAKDSAFGRIYIQRNGAVTTLKLVYQSGYVTCFKSRIERRSNWGCARRDLMTIITNGKDQRLLPQDTFMIPNARNLAYHIPGFTSESPELVFENFTIPLVVTAGQEYRLWYGEDLNNHTENDNEWKTCADVYVFGLFD